MSTITLPNIRVSSDLTVRVRLKDGGVAIDWSTLTKIKASIYSDAQRALAGRCDVSIDAEDSTLLVCSYAANKPQYVGVNRIVVSAKYMGETKTYDKPAFNFVRWTADQEGEQITIDDPDVDVEIDVEDISSSILQEAVEAAFDAADRANDAAAAAEHMVDIHTGPEGKSAYEVAVEEGYVGTEEEWLASLVGPQGPQGIQGETGEAAGFGTASASLTEDGGNPGVTVAASGSDTAKNFAFTFKNLKGDKGDKGDQGNTGSSVDYPYELVNNLTTNDATKGLTAAMGVQLEGEVSQLEHKVDKINLTSDLGTDGDDALSFVDENDNCILQAKDGHIKTKNFDSRDVVTETELDAFADTVALKDKGANPTSELAIVDENDNCIAQFKEGHIQTKDFDSKEVMLPDNEDDDTGALAIVDVNQEAIIQFKNGHIRTKNFNSAEIMAEDNEDENQAALAFVDENDNAVAQFKDGHIKTKHFDSRNVEKPKSFAYIGIDKLSVSGTSTKADGQITLAPGVANRAYLMNGFEGAHWEMSAKFVCSGGVSFVMGKDMSAYGAWLEIKLDNGVSKYTFYNNGTSSQYSGTIDFNLSAGEEYTLRLFFNVTTTKILGFEIFGQYNEYFTYTFDNVNCNGYGNPFFYSDNNCIVKEFSLSNQNYYDIKNAKAAVWGHSYVEGDSLGSNRDKTFTNLLANAIGSTKVFNFGLGGDNWLGVYNKMGNEMGIVSNIQYGLVCCGANDSGLSLADTKSRITDIVTLLQNNNIVPIIFTIAPIDRNRDGNWYNQMFVDANAWIRQNFLYVDMEQVFLDVDATGTWDASNVKTSLYLGDLIHPNVDGHAAIFRRIQMDCPYLF